MVRLAEGGESAADGLCGVRQILQRFRGVRLSALYFTGAAVVLIGASAAGQSVTSNAGPDQRIVRTDRLFSEWDTTVSPGCALSVMQNGTVVHARGYGMADLDHDVPIRPDTVFHVASMSKQFTAAAIILLSMEGKLSLDDQVRQYLPEFSEFSQPITIRELMHHTSGIRDQWELLDLAGWRYSLDLITDQDVMGLLERQKELNFPPGSQFLYDNSGFTILGQIVRRVSGQSLRDLTTDRIFLPLGMSQTHFRDDHAEVVKDNAYGYTPGKGRNEYRLSITNFDTVGATGLLTTVQDLAKWDENFYEPRIGGQRFLQLMLQPGQLKDGRPVMAGTAVYASGLELSAYRGLPIVEHNGADAGYRADLIRFPKQHFSVALLCNRADADTSEKVRQVADIFLAGAFTEAAPQPAAGVSVAEAILDRYAGLYWNPVAQRPLRLTVSEGELRTVAPDGRTEPLNPVSEMVFESSDGRRSYTFDPAGTQRPRHVTLQLRGQQKTTQAVWMPAWNPSSSVLGRYAGTYGSDEIDPHFRISAGNGELILTRLKHDPEHFRPVIEDSFEDRDGVNIHFQKNAEGQVDEFLWDSGRITNFRFRKLPADDQK
jgi:CubicO group peptidase (beta-lactamase class C family)